MSDLRDAILAALKAVTVDGYGFTSAEGAADAVTALLAARWADIDRLDALGQTIRDTRDAGHRVVSVRVDMTVEWGDRPPAATEHGLTTHADVTTGRTCTAADRCSACKALARGLDSPAEHRCPRCGSAGDDLADQVKLGVPYGRTWPWVCRGCANEMGTVIL